MLAGLLLISGAAAATALLIWIRQERRYESSETVAAAVFSGLVLQHLRTTSDFGHLTVVWIDSDDSKTFVGLENRLEQHPVAGFKNVQRQKLLREKHDVRQGEQGKFPDGKIGHGRRE